ncbi:hypothetical protein IG631_23672 [Alternaria alternata]|nr:hypothetical protein IG631_23672 [Alternaria alternata]
MSPTLAGYHALWLFDIAFCHVTEMREDDSASSNAYPYGDGYIGSGNLGHGRKLPNPPPSFTEM